MSSKTLKYTVHINNILIKTHTISLINKRNNTDLRDVDVDGVFYTSFCTTKISTCKYSRGYQTMAQRLDAVHRTSSCGPINLSVSNLQLGLLLGNVNWSKHPRMHNSIPQYLFSFAVSSHLILLINEFITW